MLSTLLLRPHIPPGLWMMDGTPRSLSLIPLFLLGTVASSNANSSPMNTSASAQHGVFQLSSTACPQAVAAGTRGGDSRLAVVSATFPCTKCNQHPAAITNTAHY